MTRALPRGLGVVLGLAASLLGAIPAAAQSQEPDSFDVVIEIDESQVTYNGEPVDGMIDLETALVEDVQQNPELSVEVVAHDSVPFQYVLQIMHMVHQYEVYGKLEILEDGPGNDDNM